VKDHRVWQGGRRGNTIRPQRYQAAPPTTPTAVGGVEGILPVDSHCDEHAAGERNVQMQGAAPRDRRSAELRHRRVRAACLLGLPQAPRQGSGCAQGRGPPVPIGEDNKPFAWTVAFDSTSTRSRVAKPFSIRRTNMPTAYACSPPTRRRWWPPRTPWSLVDRCRSCAASAE
jgi:hypothetical protein